MSAGLRTDLAEEVLRRFAATIRSGQLYSKGHPIVARNLTAFGSALEMLHRHNPTIVVGIVGDEVIVEEKPINADGITGLVRRLKQIGVERISIDRGVTADEVAAFVNAVATVEPKSEGEQPEFPPLKHVRVGRVKISQRVETSGDMASFKRLYNEAVFSAQSVWESAHHEQQPYMTVARAIIDGLAQAVSENRTALLALTTLKDYDNYTFTHMVNVSILTMGQARGLGIDGPLLREFGLAALLHDIGKVRTPKEVLNKPDKLTDAEFVIMKRHVVDGAEILRRTPDMPT